MDETTSSELDLKLPIPSLRTMSLLKIGTVLWQSPRIITEIKDHCVKPIAMGKFWDPQDHFRKYTWTYWESAERQVLQSTSDLNLPNFLNEELNEILKELGNEIYEWCNHQRPVFRIPLPFNLSFIMINYYLDKLKFTIHGTVDQKKTMDLLIQDERVDLYQRYRQACHYCLEERIPGLWEEVKRHQPYSTWISLENIVKYETPIVSLWTHSLEGKLHLVRYYLSTLQKSTPTTPILANPPFRQSIDSQPFEPKPINASPFHLAFMYACEDNGIGQVAMTYFWEKLTPPERDQSLNTIIDKIHNSLFHENIGLFPFLLPKLNPEQSRNVTSQFPKMIMSCFLSYPISLHPQFFQPLLDMADIRGYFNVLNFIVSNLFGMKSKLIFTIIWSRASRVIKEELFSRPDYVGTLLSRLSRSNPSFSTSHSKLDFDIFREILSEFKRTSRNNKKALILSDNGVTIIVNFIHRYITCKNDVVCLDLLKSYLKVFEFEMSEEFSLMLLKRCDSIVPDEDDYRFEFYWSGGNKFWKLQGRQILRDILKEMLADGSKTESDLLTPREKKLKPSNSP